MTTERPMFTGYFTPAVNPLVRAHPTRPGYVLLTFGARGHTQVDVSLTVSEAEALQVKLAAVLAEISEATERLLAAVREEGP